MVKQVEPGKLYADSDTAFWWKLQCGHRVGVEIHNQPFYGSPKGPRVWILSHPEPAAKH